MSATRRDVAKLANVSVATVSCVFNKKRYVSDELTQKVLTASKHLSYMPNMIASSLSSKKTNVIGVLCDDLTSSLQMSLVKCLQNEAMKKGYFVNVCGGESHFDEFIDNFIARRVDAVYIAVRAERLVVQQIKGMLDSGIKVALSSAFVNIDSRLNGIGFDMDYGIKLILEYLKDNNHKQIAFLSCYNKDYKADARFFAFKKYMKSYFGESSPIIISGKSPFDSTVNVGCQMMEDLLATGKKFSCVVCANDAMAIGAIFTLYKHNIKVPDDVSVVGIDNIDLSQTFVPALTTINHRVDVVGKSIFDMLYKDLKEDKKTIEIIKPELIIRASTKKIDRS